MLNTPTRVNCGGQTVRNNDDTVLSTWIEQVAEVDDSACEGNRKRTYTNTLFSSLKVRRDNVLNITSAGRTRWKIETETFNCLKNHSYHLKHNFDYGRVGLANTLATINLFTFELHTIMDCLCVL